MPKQSGLGWTTLSVDDAAGTPRDIRNDVHSWDFATPREVQDVTGIDKSAFERILLLADFTGTLNIGAFNPTANLSHSVLSSVSSTNVTRTLTNTVGGKSLNGEVWFTDYALERADSGALSAKAPFVLADGAVPTWA